MEFKEAKQSVNTWLGIVILFLIANNDRGSKKGQLFIARHMKGPLFEAHWYKTWIIIIRYNNFFDCVSKSWSELRINILGNQNFLKWTNMSSCSYGCLTLFLPCVLLFRLLLRNKRSLMIHISEGSFSSSYDIIRNCLLGRFRLYFFLQIMWVEGLVCLVYYARF